MGRSPITQLFMRLINLVLIGCWSWDLDVAL